MPPKMPPTAIFRPPPPGTTVCNPLVIEDEDVVTMQWAEPIAPPKQTTPAPQANKSTEQKRWMTMPTTMKQEKASPILLGEGAYKRLVRSYVVPKTRAEFFKTSYPKMDSKDPELNRYFERQAGQFPVTRRSMMVKTSDGSTLVVFLKNGMTIGRPLEEFDELRKQSEDAAAEVINCDRNKPKADNRVEAIERKRALLKPQGLKLIRKHFSYHMATGRQYGPEYIHTDARKTDTSTQAEFNACVRYMKDTAWEHEQISRLVKMVDTEGFHEEALARYQSLGQEKLQHLYQGPEGIHLGSNFLVNVASGPHRDVGDMLTAWTTTNTWGAYTGGHLVLPELGLRIDQQPNDVTLMHARVLIHMITEIAGNRICNVRYSNQHITRPMPPPPKLPLVCPFGECSKIKESESSFFIHLTGPLSKDANARAKAKGSKAYHFLERKEAKAMLEHALAVYEARQGKGKEVEDPNEMDGDVEMGEEQHGAEEKGEQNPDEAMGGEEGQEDVDEVMEGEEEEDDDEEMGEGEEEKGNDTESGANAPDVIVMDEDND
ncbi:MAG: hypothetical protein Q9188_003589 [Gyalolechia gomerana]